MANLSENCHSERSEESHRIQLIDPSQSSCPAGIFEMTEYDIKMIEKAVS